MPVITNLLKLETEASTALKGAALDLMHPSYDVNLNHVDGDNMHPIAVFKTHTSAINNTKHFIFDPNSESIQITDASTGRTSSIGSERAQTWLNVKDFGALGNGVADDTVALTNALAAAETTKAGVYLPGGTYLVSSTLHVRGKTTLRGVGKGSIIKMSPAVTADIIKCGNGTKGTDDLFTIIDLWLDGSQSSGTPASPDGFTGRGIVLDNCWNGLISRVFIEKTKGFALDVMGSNALVHGGCSRCIISESVIHSCMGGIIVRDDTVDTIVDNVYVENILHFEGIKLYQAYGTRLINTHIFLALKNNGIVIEQSNATIVTNCFSETHWMNGIVLSDSKNTRITDCTIFNNGKPHNNVTAFDWERNGIKMYATDTESCKGNVISNCFLYDDQVVKTMLKGINIENKVRGTTIMHNNIRDMADAEKIVMNSWFDPNVPNAFDGQPAAHNTVIESMGKNGVVVNNVFTDNVLIKNKLELVQDLAYKPSTSTWTISSDERLKENIVQADLDRCYEIVSTLPLKHYAWREEMAARTRDKTKLGWIAQDVELHLPKAVAKSEAFGIPDCRSLDTDQIYAVMYGAIQKLQNKVEALELLMASPPPPPPA